MQPPLSIEPRTGAPTTRLLIVLPGDERQKGPLKFLRNIS